MQSVRTFICLDGLNWLTRFWEFSTDIEFTSDPWKALQKINKTVGEFLTAAVVSNYDINLVIDADTKTLGTYELWRTQLESQLSLGKRGVCLGADFLLAESFQRDGVSALMPIGANADDVLAAIAVVKSGVVLSKDRDFFNYNIPINVSTDFNVDNGKLILKPCDKIDHSQGARRPIREVQPHLTNLATNDRNWSLGIVKKYRPSLKNGIITRGLSSSSDKIMGNLHIIARPLGALVYAILGEKQALERMLEWSEKENKLVFLDVEVRADPTFIHELKDRRAVITWLVKHDSPVMQLEPWRAKERIFNSCVLASELLVASSHGRETMHKCKEFFSQEVSFLKTCKSYDDFPTLSDNRLGNTKQKYHGPHQRY